MAGKSRKQLKLFAKNIKANVKVPSTQSDEQQTWSVLPTDILGAILSQLTLKDNIRASAVCKTWLGVGISVRIADKPPWLMIVPKFGNSFEFYDPSQRKSYWLELPELRGCEVCYAKDGWLLLVKPKTTHIFLFCPYTRESIQLPYLSLGDRRFAFSASPTSPSCIVFAVENGRSLTITVSTYRPGATEWATVNFPNIVHYFGISDKVVFSKGRFYCLDLYGWVGIFYPDHCWVVFSVPTPKCPETFYGRDCWKRQFVAEHDGEIFAIFTCSTLNPIVYRLDRRNVVWVEMESLEGITLFANHIPSHGRTNPHGTMMNSVFFPKIQFYGKRCVSYSLDHKRYYPRNLSFDWSEHYDSLKSIWIEAPEDLSTFH